MVISLRALFGLCALVLATNAAFAQDDASKYPTRPIRIMTEPQATAAEAAPALLRPLAEYEAALGGGF